MSPHDPESIFSRSLAEHRKELDLAWKQPEASRMRHLYRTHAFLGSLKPDRSTYLLVQWGHTVNGPGIQLIVRGVNLWQFGFRPQAST